MKRPLILIAACLSMAGCATFDSTANIQNRIPLQSMKVSPEEVAALPAGAQVMILNLHPGGEISYRGTVLQSGPLGVALVNCEETGRTYGTPVSSKIPGASRIFKNSGVGVTRVPVEWIPIRDMSIVEVIEPPPSGYVAPQLNLNLDDGTHFERIGIDFDFNEPLETHPDRIIVPSVRSTNRQAPNEATLRKQPSDFF